MIVMTFNNTFLSFVFRSMRFNIREGHAMIVMTFNTWPKMLGLKFRPMPRMNGFLIHSNLNCIHVRTVAAESEQFKARFPDDHT